VFPLESSQAAEPVFDIDIPAMNAADALNRLAEQTGSVMLFSYDLAQPRQANAVRGRYTLLDGLERVLRGTGLSGGLSDKRVVMIAEEGAMPTASEGSIKKRGVFANIIAALAFGAADGAETEQNSASVKLEEIIVTAQKREERLIDTPQSISVLSADSLDKIGATQFRDFANTVPGLSFSTAGAGNTQVSLRGVTIGQDLGATVGIYVDETPYGSSAVFAFGPYLALDVGLFDIERVEVLRGPQGTLYGASTMGGLIKYVSKRPDAREFAWSTQAGVSQTEQGGVNYDVSGVINLPIATDKAALRASAFQSHDGGYVNNIAAGRDDVNRSDIYGGRLDLLLTPNEQLDIRFMAFLQNIERDGEATADYLFSGDQPIGSLNQNRLFDEPFYQQFRLLSGTVVYDFGGVSLTSISTYQTVSSELTWDLSATFAPLLNSFGFGPYSAVGNPNWADTDKFSQEIRLVSQGGGALEWALGAFYTSEESELYTEFLLRDLEGNPAPNTLFTYRAPTSFDEYAVFGDLTWRFTQKFDVTGGIRFAHNDQEFTQFGSGVLGANVPTRESDEDVVTYLGSARYYMSDRATAYLRYATGYRPGGPNIVTVAGGAPTFDSDELESYEAGIKAETVDQRFGIDLSGYYIDWNDIQISVNVGGFTSYTNAPGGATVTGAELALTGRPANGLTLSGVFAWQDAQLSEADANLGGAKGERLPNVPEFMTTLNADYEFADKTLQPTLGATLRYVGERQSSFDESTSFPQYDLPDYTTFDLRAGLNFGNINTQFYIHNLTDERGQLSLFFPQFGARVAILQPRTIGVSLTMQF
jgi:outer membrane receptor protein involved in Fe transport